MNNILLFITPKKSAINIPEQYKDSFKRLQNKYNVTIYICYQEDVETSLIPKVKEKLEEEWFIFQKYNSTKDLLNFSKELKWPKNNIEVYTYREALIKIMEQVKESLWQEITWIKDIFISKKLQRENLFKYNKNITVNFLKFNNTNEINIEKVLEEFDFPFIIKPSAWISSSGVSKINSKKDFENVLNNLNKTFDEIIKISKIDNYEVVIEEFIEWKMYTIDYFVDQKWNIYKSKLVRTNTLKDEYNIEDFWITKEILWLEIDMEITEEKLDNYLEQCVKWCKIKNTFIHHEFKLTENSELKTIELNGRIWGYRLEMYKESYGIDLVEMFFNKQNDVIFLNNYTFIGLFPQKELGKKFCWLNKDFIKNVIKLDSFYKYTIKENLIWKKIWFTKNGYKYFWSIRLLNKTFSRMEEEYQYIKENLDKNILYKKKELLILVYKKNYTIERKLFWDYEKLVVLKFDNKVSSIVERDGNEENITYYSIPWKLSENNSNIPTLIDSLFLIHKEKFNIKFLGLWEYWVKSHVQILNKQKTINIDYEIFRNKKKMSEFLGEKLTWKRSIILKTPELNYDFFCKSLRSEVFVLKPLDEYWSSEVFIIKNNKQLEWLKDKLVLDNYLIEIFIQWDLKSIDFMFEAKWENPIQNNFWVIQFYSEIEWVLLWFDEEIITKIKKLKSFFSINIIEKHIGKMVWLTAKWYWKVITLRVKNNNSKQLNIDLEYIKDNYKNILLLK